MLPVREAIERIAALVEPVGTERVRLAAAGGRTLREDLAARISHPQEPVSAMDGYGVRAEDAREGAELAVVGVAPAGGSDRLRLGAGEAIRLFTGSVIPEGASAVAIQEAVSREGDRIVLQEDVPEGRFIRAAGLDFRAGDLLLHAPLRLTPGHIAIAAAMNHSELGTARKPRVAILPTGDELIPPGETPGFGQVIASTGYGIAAMLAADGADPILLDVAPDDPRKITAQLSGTRADLLVTLGGASVGDRDFIGQALAGREIELAFHGVAMRPGKPLLAGRFGATPLVGLPGNPVSAMVCAHVFLRPALDALLGFAAGPRPRRTGVLGCALRAGTAREHYMRARIEFRGTEAVVHPVAQQDSSVLREFAAANALAIRPPEAPPARPGDAVEYLEL